MRRFVIAAQGLTADHEAALRDYLKTKGAWWHWIANLWLLATNDENVSAGEIRDEIKAIAGASNIRTLVFEFPEDIDWASSGAKNADGRRMSDWLAETWGRDVL